MAGRMAAWGTKVVSKTTSGTLALSRVAQPHLQTFWGHARVELVPPTPSQWPAIRQGFGNLFNSTLSGKFLDCSVKEATRNSLVAVEIACWFYVGEMIGRKSIIGYKV
ncbi:ATP synthase subunit g, mitochondrial [Geodia barretti]|uniref:ATP synthase subunit g, mitochondrial n=1 Tax=Geodia barretti TaxID=519541 RepID=A0AA35SLD1_GEOBA|nr:ATP synthase subunit g, mitochondrial [Geodia barretti]